jgi:hypothetical protein
MWQKIFTTFFLGQVALEQLAEAAQSGWSQAKDKTLTYQEKIEELRDIDLLSKVEHFSKEKIAHLRSCSEPFEKTCIRVADFLSETAALKSKLISDSNH